MCCVCKAVLLNLHCSLWLESIRTAVKVTIFKHLKPGCRSVDKPGFLDLKSRIPVNSGLHSLVSSNLHVVHGFPCLSVAVYSTFIGTVVKLLLHCNAFHYNVYRCIAFHSATDISHFWGVSKTRQIKSRCTRTYRHHYQNTQMLCISGSLYSTFSEPMKSAI